MVIDYGRQEEVSPMKCPKCRTENRKGAKFCPECGQPFQEELVYPGCGHTNPQNGKLCDEFRHSLTKPTTAPVSPTLPEPTSFTGGRYQVNKGRGVALDPAGAALRGIDMTRYGE